MSNKIITILCLLSVTMSVMGQYVSPNQAGRKGGDNGPGLGRQVVMTTVYGNSGNPSGQGVLFSINKDGSNPAAFHDFVGYPLDASYPYYMGVQQLSDGKLYGLGSYGGTNNQGCVWRYDFKSCDHSIVYNEKNNGYDNRMMLNELSDGRIYYATTLGGGLGAGALYSMKKDGSDVKLLHTFSEGNLVTYTTAAQQCPEGGGPTPLIPYSEYRDSHWPYGFVVEGPDGKVYGVAEDGGTHSWGSIFRCSKDGSNYEIIYSSDPFYRYNYYKDGQNNFIYGSRNGTFLHGNLAFTSTGKIVFSSRYGGVNDIGGVFLMDADGSNFKILKSFDGGTGYYPYRGVTVVDSRVYGTCVYGGYNTSIGGVGGAIGTIWGVNLDGSNFQLLKAFGPPYNEGVEPTASLSYDGTHLWGTCRHYGGAGSTGTLFKVKPDGTDFQKVYSFKQTAGNSCYGRPGTYSYYPSLERITFANASISCSKSCVDGAVCATGNAVPVLNKTLDSIVCPDMTYDLSSVQFTGVPTGCIVNWNYYPEGDPYDVIDDAAKTHMPVGTYYASLYDTSNGCSPASGANASFEVKYVTCCMSGSAAPILSTVNIVVSCPDSMTDLNEIEACNAPTGAQLSWHTGTPATMANMITKIDEVPTGVPYYAAYYDPAKPCFSATRQVNTSKIPCCKAGTNVPLVKN
jgi:hypothetical protein